MARIVVPGGTGYLGQELARRLVDRGDDVVVLTRGPSEERDGVLLRHWDGATLGDWVEHLDGADAIVHLTGRRVDTRATRAHVDELISSRVGPVQLVGEAVRRCAAPAPVWIQSSSLALFGDRGEEVIDERSTPSGIGPREMVTVCLAWESAFALAAATTERTVLLRMGIGFGGPGDPATEKLATLVRLGLGGPVSTGRQWVSWVDLADLVAVMLRAIDDRTMRGTYHVTSPNPVTNAELMATFRRLLGCSVGLRSPALLTRIGAPLLGSSASLALTGRRCVPARLIDEGFAFAVPHVEPAVRHALVSCGALRAA
jgi:uncharacterized protein (TIGR01777 family)